jgi:molybdopterin synthase catalytic subunit
LIQIIDRAIVPHVFFNDIKANDSGSLVMHIGIVRPSSEGKKVTSVEYQIEKEEAAARAATDNRRYQKQMANSGYCFTPPDG